MNSLLKQCQLEGLRTFRNRQFVVFSVAMPLIFYFIFVKVDGANLAVGGTSWKTYFLVSMASFSVIGACIFGLSSRIAYERTQGWLRLLQTTPMRLSSFIAGKVLAQIAISVLSILVLFIVGACAEGVHMTFLQWLGSLLWLSIGSVPFIMLGLFIGVLVSVEATYLVANIVNLVLAILGGLWFPTSIMPAWMQKLSAWMPTYRFTHVAWQTVAGQGMSATDFLAVIGYSILFLLLTLLVLRKHRTREA